MKVNFYLIKRPDKDDLCRIYLFCRYEGNEFKFNTEEKVKIKHWNKKQQYILTADLKASEKNERLRFIRKNIDTAFYFYKNQGIAPNNELLKEKLNELINKKPIIIKTFFEYYIEFLELQKPPYKDQKTLQKFKTVLNHLQTFEIQYNYKINFNTLNDVFETKFYDYFFKKSKSPDNTFSKYMKCINQFLKWSFEKNYYSAPKHIYFKVKEKKQEIIFLNASEFLSLYNAEIVNKRLANIRDLFCFGCVTGMRFAAMQRLTTNNIQGNFIFYIADKSKKPTLVPLTDYAKNIIEKHKGNAFLLPQITNQKANKYLKELTQNLGFERIISQQEFKRSETKLVHYKLYEKLSFKISKKTCVTLLHGLGVQPEIIGIFTANTPETLKHYLGTDKTQAIEQFLDVFDSLEK